MPRVTLAFLCLLAVFGVSGAAIADVVTDWNARAIQASTRANDPDMPTSRSLAIMHLAMFTAINSVSGKYEPLVVQANAAPDAMPAVAASIAADRVLDWLYPEQREAFDDELCKELAIIPEGMAKADSITLGYSVADKVITWRSNDHVGDVVPFTPCMEPGDWQPTLPDYTPALAPQWAIMTPFAIESNAQFRPSPPPALNSHTFISDFNEVKTLGALHSRTRTADQTATALFWGDHPGSECSVGVINDMARQIALQKGRTLAENARLFALLDVTMADALIATWDAKYYYHTWRPITAIREADRLSNPLLTADPEWEPLLPTPSFPEYPAAHSVFSSAGMTILAHIFGDAQQFSTTSNTNGPITRSYHSFSQVAEECGRSRIYGGVHFQFSNLTGMHMGSEIGEYVWEHALRPVG